MNEKAKAEATKGPSNWQRIKLVVLALVALLFLVVILQNTEGVEAKLLFFTISVPKAVMLFGALIVGFVLGIVTANRVFTRK